MCLLELEWSLCFLSVPFICKSWYTTSLNPLSFQNLLFLDFMPSPLFTVANKIEEPLPRSFGPFYDKFIDQCGIDKTRFSITAFVKFAVNRSNGLATQLKLPEFCTQEGLMFVSDACPFLKNAWLPDDLVIFKTSHVIPQLIGKWKFLESLVLGFGMLDIMDQYEMDGKPDFLSGHFEELLTLKNFVCLEVLHEIVVQIGAHCKRFTDLTVYHTSLCEVEASMIVKLLPNLKKLSLNHCRIDQDSVVSLLRRCKELVLFNASQLKALKRVMKKYQSLVLRFLTFRARVASAVIY